MAVPDATVKLLVRTANAASVLVDPVQLLPTAMDNVSAGKAMPSPDGRHVAALTPETVDLYDTSSGARVTSLPAAGVLFADWSSGGAYLTTAKRGIKGEGNAPPPKNVQVWEVASGAVVLELHARSVTRESWPLVQWAPDDSAALHAVTNTVTVYKRAEGFHGASAKRVPVKGVGAFCPCPAPGKNLLAAFVPESKGQPAAAMLLDISSADPVTLSRRSFYRATGAEMLWNARGSAALFIATCETDATNQSYYGESKLHYLPADPARADAACAVSLPKEGPVHDVRWSPTGDCFVVAAGYMPARVLLFDDACRPIYDLGAGPYNTVRWSPSSRFLLVAGFGNLPGDMLFFEKKAKGICKQMGATRSEAVTAAWSPCGRYVLAATTAPRLRVDNGVRVFTYTGEKVAEKKFEILFEAQWLPAPPGTFADRPASPERLAAAASTSGRGLATPAPKPAAYVPPAYRNAGGASAPAATFSLGTDATVKPGRIPVGGAATTNNGKPLPPGAEFVSKSAAKNAKKRAAKKASTPRTDGDGAVQDGPPPALGQQSSAAAEDRSGGGASARPAPVTTAAAAEGVAALALGGDGADPVQKRVRALQKKLRQIQQLKERRAAEGDEALESEQLSKIAAEAEVAAEIRALGGSVS